MPCVYVGKVVVSAMHFLPSSNSSGIGVWQKVKKWEMNPLAFFPIISLCAVPTI